MSNSAYCWGSGYVGRSEQVREAGPLGDAEQECPGVSVLIAPPQPQGHHEAVSPSACKVNPRPSASESIHLFIPCRMSMPPRLPEQNGGQILVSLSISLDVVNLDT